MVGFLFCNASVGEARRSASSRSFQKSSMAMRIAASMREASRYAVREQFRGAPILYRRGPDRAALSDQIARLGAHVREIEGEGR